MRFNYLETGFTSDPNISAPRIINEIFDLVKMSDDLGYEAFWMSEHYSPKYSWLGSPEMYLPILAGISDRINIGTAAILAKYHSPLRLAQNFQILSALFPGRIDLGISNADIPQEMLFHVLNQKNEYPNLKFKEVASLILSYLNNDIKMSLGEEEIKIYPNSNDGPRLWVMGNSEITTATGINIEANLCLSLYHNFIDMNYIQESIEQYSSEFQKVHSIKPEISILVGVACSDNRNICSKLIDAYSIKKTHHIIGSKNECLDKINKLIEALKLESITFSVLTDKFSIKEETLLLKESL